MSERVNGGDGSFRSPMGVTVIGGLIFSTILTLLIVPGSFSIAVDMEKWIGRRFGRFVAAGKEAPPPQAVPLPAE